MGSILKYLIISSIYVCNNIYIYIITTSYKVSSNIIPKVEIIEISNK